MERVLPQLIASGVVVVMLLGGTVYRRWRVRRPPGTIMRMEKPIYKNILGWFVIASAVMPLLLYVADPSDPRWPIISVGMVVVGAITLRAPSYSEMSEAQRAENEKMLMIATAIVIAYFIVHLLLVAFASEQAVIVFDSVYFCALFLWVVWWFRRFSRV